MYQASTAETHIFVVHPTLINMAASRSAMLSIALQALNVLKIQIRVGISPDWFRPSVLRIEYDLQIAP